MLCIIRSFWFLKELIILLIRIMEEKVILLFGYLNCFQRMLRSLWLLIGILSQWNISINWNVIRSICLQISMSWGIWSKVILKRNCMLKGALRVNLCRCLRIMSRLFRLLVCMWRFIPIVCFLKNKKIWSFLRFQLRSCKVVWIKLTEIKSEMWRMLRRCSSLFLDSGQDSSSQVNKNSKTSSTSWSQLKKVWQRWNSSQ